MPDDDLNGDLDNAVETSHRRNRVGCARVSNNLNGLIALLARLPLP